MPKFTDEEGRDWVLRIDVVGVRRVREALEVDLGSLAEVAPNFAKLAEDPCLLCDVLFVLCEEQAKSRGLTDTDFGRLLAGGVIYEATLALEEAIINFFPPKKKSLLQRLQKKVSLVQEMGEGLISEKLEDKALMDRIREKMKERMNSLVTGSLTESNSVSTLPDKPE